MNSTTRGYEYTQSLAFRVSTYFFGLGFFLGFIGTVGTVCQFIPWPAGAWIFAAAGTAILLAFIIAGVLGHKQGLLDVQNEKLVQSFQQELDSPDFMAKLK